MSPLAQPALWNRPDELARATERPGHPNNRFRFLQVHEDEFTRRMVSVVKEKRIELRLRSDHVVLDGGVVTPQSQWVDQDELADALGIGRREFRRDHPAERVTDHGRRFEPELIEQLVVVEDEIPEIVERLDRVRVALAGARMLRCIDRKIARKLVKKVAPNQPISAVQKEQRLTLPGDLDMGGDLVFPEINRAF